VKDRRKLPALDNAQKLTKPDLNTIGDKNYVDTILRYGGLATHFVQLDTKAKYIVPAINEIIVYPNPPETPTQTLNKVKIDNTIYALSGGSTVIPNPPDPSGALITEDGHIILIESGSELIPEQSSGGGTPSYPPLVTVSIDGTIYSIAGDYTLPIASADTLGGIKVGEGLHINSETGVLSTDNGIEYFPGVGVYFSSAVTENFTTAAYDESTGISYTECQLSYPTTSDSIRIACNPPRGSYFDFRYDSDTKVVTVICRDYVPEGTPLEINYQGINDRARSINAEVGRKSPTYLQAGLSSDYISSERKDAWRDTQTVVDGNHVYTNNGGTTGRSKGFSLGKITVTGTESASFFVKQDSTNTNTAYVLISKPDKSFKVTVTETFTGDGTTTTFTVAHDVYTPGVISTSPSYYSGQWSGNNVVFSVAPSVGTTISATYEYIDITDSSLVLKSYKGLTTEDYVECPISFGDGRTATNIYKRTVDVLYVKDGDSSINDSSAYIYYTVGAPYFGNLGEVFNDYAWSTHHSNYAIGYQAHAEGGDSLAFGNRSHAEGQSKAIGGHSHSEGTGLALGNLSHAEGEDTTTTNTSAHAEGRDTLASGWQAHAEGESTQATGHYSHSEGTVTVASNQAAHAEGTSTQASGDSAHAEGNKTVASNSQSHAEGDNTKATGPSAHAEGGSTVASGNRSHAEGNMTTASGDYSHAEGNYTQATNYYAHAEGQSSIASGSDGAHAEGNSTKAIGVASHSEGLYSQAQGTYAHAEGNSTTASGDNSHAEGEHTTASGFDAHAEGQACVASNSYSHAEGQHTTASGQVSHAEGYYTTASGTDAHAEGISTISSGYGSHAEGENTQALQEASHAEGEYTIAASRDQHVFGKYNIADIPPSGGTGHGTYVEIVGNGTSDNARSNVRTLDWNGNEYVAGRITVGLAPLAGMDVATKKYVDDHGGGGGGGLPSIKAGTGIAAELFNQMDEYNESTASGDYSHAEGISTTSSGPGAHAEGHSSIASGLASHAEGTTSFGGPVTASGVGSHAEGSGTIAQGDASHIEGTRGLAYGEATHVEGSGNLGFGRESHAEGSGNVTGGDHGHTEGAGNYNVGYSSHVEGAGNSTLPNSNITHTEGAGNANYGVQAHVEGAGNNLSGEESHVEGAGNKIHGAKTHAEGGGNNIYALGSHVEGKHNDVTGFAVHAEGSHNFLGVSENISPFVFGTTYAVGDIVGPNALYNPDYQNETTRPFIYRCITAPGQIQASNAVQIISPSTWSASTTYVTGDVVKFVVSNAYGQQITRYYYATNDVPTGQSPLENNKWSRITSLLTPFKTTTSNGYYLLNPESESKSGSGNVAKVTGTVAAMWEPIDSIEGTHVEGYYNIAIGNYQHVGGKYNVADANKAVIIGNGEDDGGVVTRSNALTLDWSGNLVIAGDLTTGTTLSTSSQSIAAAINELYSELGSEVSVTQVQSTGTKIAEITIDGTTTDIYSPNGGGGGSTVVVEPVVQSGVNIADITVDGTTSHLYTPNAVGSVTVTQTQQSGTKVAEIDVDGTSTDLYAPTPTSVSIDDTLSTGTKVATITIDGTDTEILVPSAGSSVQVTQIQDTGTHIADIEVDGVTTELYAPNGGGGAVIDDNDIALDKTWSSSKINSELTSLADRIEAIERYLFGIPLITENGDQRITEDGSDRILEQEE